MKIKKNVLCFYSSGGRLSTSENGRLTTSESEDPPEPTWKRVLELLRSVQVAIVGVNLAIADYKGEGEIEFIEPPAILDDPEFFDEPEDSSGK